MLRNKDTCVILERKDSAFYELWFWYASSWDMCKFSASFTEVRQALGISLPGNQGGGAPLVKQMSELLAILPPELEMDFARRSCFSYLTAYMANCLLAYKYTAGYRKSLTAWDGMKLVWLATGQCPKARVFNSAGEVIFDNFFVLD